MTVWEFCGWACFFLFVFPLAIWMVVQITAYSWMNARDNYKRKRDQERLNDCVNQMRSKENGTSK